jgi:cell division protein FtsA
MTHKGNIQNFVAAIDLGSSHCTTLIASRNLQTNETKIVGMGQVPTRGVRRATIINLEEATDTIERSLAAAEKICGHNVDSVYLNVSGKHVDSQNSQGVVVVADANNEINEADVDRAIEAARAISLPADREVLNLTPRFFTVDGQEGIRDPIGMVGVRLETEVHLITCASSAVRNSEKAMTDIGLSVDAFVFSGYGASEVVLGEDEKEAGAICIDIGADTTSFCVYVDGAIQISGVIPIGGRYITQDINAYTHVGLENSEKIKIALSEDQGEPTPQGPDESREEYRRRLRSRDVLNLADFDPNLKVRPIYKSAIINTVIAARLKEIFAEINTKLKARHLSPAELGAGAVVVGGAAKTVCLPEIASQALNMQVRLGIPKNLPGVIRHLDDPAFATAIGLLDYGLRAQVVSVEKNSPSNNKTSGLGNFFGGLGEAIKKFMP